MNYISVDGIVLSVLPEPMLLLQAQSKRLCVYVYMKGPIFVSTIVCKRSDNIPPFYAHESGVI